MVFVPYYDLAVAPTQPIVSAWNVHGFPVQNGFSMIKYQLVCANDHTFDAWFRDSAAYDQQAGSGEVLCPACGTAEVSKALMAPRLARRKGADDAPKVPAAAPEAPAEPTAPQPAMMAAAMGQALRALKAVVEKNCDYVGEKFAEEARKIHYGETEARGIYGETTPAEAEELREEGVEFHTVPWTRNDA